MQASDNALNTPYAADVTGAWKGLNPTSTENPPGTDNGGFGFTMWDFAGGYHQSLYSPYGRLNHFIDGVDFATTSYNNLGAPAFALTNSNFQPSACDMNGCPFGGETSRATRSFVSALSPGNTLSVNFNNPPGMTPEVPWSPAGFLIRLNTGHGPVIENDPNSTATERLLMFAGTGLSGTPGLFGNNWGVADAAGYSDTGVTVGTTTAGTEFLFTLQTAETYEMALKRLSDGAVLYSHSGSLSAAGAGAIDTIEIAIYGNGSGNGLTGATMQRTGEREFYFNNLRVNSSSTLGGDYNQNGVVDAADYVVWRKGLDTAYTQSDYGIWRMNFGMPLAALGTTLGSVPEPSVACLAGISFGLALSRLLLRRRYGALDT